MSSEDVMDVVHEQADHSVKSLANLQDDEDLFAGIVPSTRRRAVWLGINLLTALLAASLVGVAVPLILKRMYVDPAPASGVILTTFTDCIGFATLLGLGTIFLT